MLQSGRRQWKLPPRVAGCEFWDTLLWDAQARPAAANLRAAGAAPAKSREKRRKMAHDAQKTLGWGGGWAGMRLANDASGLHLSIRVIHHDSVFRTLLHDNDRT